MIAGSLKRIAGLPFEPRESGILLAETHKTSNIGFSLPDAPHYQSKGEKPWRQKESI